MSTHALVVVEHNRWGEFEWQGAWSDKSAEFAACKEELEDDGIDSNDSVGDDGMFWMCASHAIKLPAALRILLLVGRSLLAACARCSVPG